MKNIKSTNKLFQEEKTKVVLTQVGSAIGRKFDQRQTLIGLGLNKMHKKVTIDINSSMEGMIRKVKHLLKIEHIN